MDPRHPEAALTRIEQLIKQFKSIIDKINTESITNKIGQLEREGGLVVQEICLVAPRLHEAMMQASRQRRQDLSRWNGNVTREVVAPPLYNVGDAEVDQAKGESAKRVAPVEVVKKLVEMPHDGYLSVDEVIEEMPVEAPEEKPKKKRKYTKNKKVEE